MKRRQQGILTGMPFMANIASRTFVDNLDRRLYLPHPPSRIVSLAPSVTEMFFALGSGNRVIAVSQFCDYPLEAGEKPKIDGMRPGLDSFMALKSDLIVAPRAFVDPVLIDQLEQLKINVYVMEAKTVEDVFSHLHTLGRVLERRPTAAQLVADLRRRIQHIKERTASLPRPRLLYVLSHQPLMTVGPDSFIHHLIELAGAENVGAGAGQGYPAISMEEVLKQNPDVIVFPSGDLEGISGSEQQQWQDRQDLNAVRTGRLYHIDSALMNRPGPRIIEGLERLATSLHPSAFPDILPSGSPSA